MIITKDKIVSFNYTLRGTDNEVMDMSGTDPLVYLHGHENIIPGLEKAMEGKTVGDKFNVSIPAAEAYGEWDENLITDVPRSSFEGIKELAEGMQFEAQFPNGSHIVTVTKITESIVTVDGNHPLAGEDLNFDVDITEIRDATDEEIAHGHPHYEHEGCDGCHEDDECHAGDDCGGCCHEK